MGTSQTPKPVHGYERIAHALSRYLGVSEVLKRHESNMWTYYLMHMVRELLRGYLAVGLEKFPGLLRNALATLTSILDESVEIQAHLWNKILVDARKVPRQTGFTGLGRSVAWLGCAFRRHFAPLFEHSSVGDGKVYLRVGRCL